jgi:hypothetical protein
MIKMISVTYILIIDLGTAVNPASQVFIPATVNAWPESDLPLKLSLDSAFLFVCTHIQTLSAASHSVFLRTLY